MENPEDYEINENAPEVTEEEYLKSKQGVLLKYCMI